MMEMMQRKSCARNRKLIYLVICVCHQGQTLIYKKHLFGASLAPELQHILTESGVFEDLVSSLPYYL